MPRCNLCLKNHALRHCSVFVAFTIEKRRTYLLKWNYCLNCMAHTHQRSDCQSENRCAICGAKHHSMVHIEHPHDVTTSSIEEENPPQLMSEEPHQIQNDNLAVQVQETPEIPSTPLELLLMELPSRPPHWEITIPPLIQVTLIHNENPMRVTFLLDETATTTYLQRSVAALFPDFTSDYQRGETEYGVFHVAPTYYKPIARWTLPLRKDAIRVPPPIKDPQLVAHFKSVAPQAHPFFATHRTIDGVIGSRMLPLIMTGTVEQLDKTLPKAQRSIFGWVISGVWNGCSCHPEGRAGGC